MSPLFSSSWEHVPTSHTLASHNLLKHYNFDPSHDQQALKNNNRKHNTKKMKVANFMVPKSNVVSCFPDDTLDTIIKKMLENAVGSVIVMGDDMPMGIVTKTDLIAAWQQGFAENL